MLFNALGILARMRTDPGVLESAEVRKAPWLPDSAVIAAELTLRRKGPAAAADLYAEAARESLPVFADSFDLLARRWKEGYLVLPTAFAERIEAVAARVHRGTLTTTFTAANPSRPVRDEPVEERFEGWFEYKPHLQGERKRKPRPDG